MLPILQAPAEDNSTVATVINRFNMDITSKIVWLYEEMQYGANATKPARDVLLYAHVMQKYERILTVYNKT